MSEMENQMECCATCEYCLAYPRGNRFGDVDYLCVITGYFVHSIHKDIRTVRHFSPGGRELECQYRSVSKEKLVV